MSTTVGNSTVTVLDADPFAENNLVDPYPMHERLRDAGAVVYLERYRVWAMARHAEVHAGLRPFAPRPTYWLTNSSPGDGSTP